MTGKRHTEESRERISATKRAKSGRGTESLVPQLCACGCGEYAAVDERRNRVSKYKSGHNARSAHPFEGKQYTDETKAKLAAYTGEKGSAYKHGWAQTPTHKSWSAMISRCYHPSNKSYPYYGASGIVVCERWRESFVNFLVDMGERPCRDYQIDRRDPDLGYWCGHCDECKRKGWVGNCRWLTRAENNARRRDPGGWIKKRAQALAAAQESAAGHPEDPEPAAVGTLF
jgi:hypothetical protein